MKTDPKLYDYIKITNKIAVNPNITIDRKSGCGQIVKYEQQDINRNSEGSTMESKELQATDHNGNFNFQDSTWPTLPHETMAADRKDIKGQTQQENKLQVTVIEPNELGGNIQKTHDNRNNDKLITDESEEVQFINNIMATNMTRRHERIEHKAEARILYYIKPINTNIKTNLIYFEGFLYRCSDAEVMQKIHTLEKN